VRVTLDAQGKPWFQCPKCGGLCRHVYLPEVLCRRYGHLDFSCRDLHRSPLGAGVRRVMKLRRKLGVDPTPFGAIPWGPRRRHRQPALIREIQTLERRLLAALSTIKGDLARQLQRQER